jgi:hypothetical protein
MLPYKQVDIDVPVEPMLREYVRIKHLLSPYRDFVGFQVYGHRWVEGEPGITETSWPRLLPNTMSWISEIMDLGSQKGIVAFQVMQPGGRLPTHRDKTTRGFLDGSVNVALTNPAGCGFVFEGFDPVPMRAGIAFMIDNSFLHHTYNDDEKDRIHLYLQGNFNPRYVRD